MARVYFKLSARDIRSAIKKQCTDPIIALSKNPDVMRLIAERANELVKPYVPMKSGDLRNSAYVNQTSKATQLVWGKRGFGKTFYYARYQHDANDSNWKRTTSGTESYWTRRIEPGTPGFKKLVEYAEPLVKKEVKK